ncbi:kinetochore protein Spc25 [Esox lucius]|uniref:Kinetochore protein SPC25 n=1 Tax=Esox lucius TaxID=8010 RepID=A0A3P8YZ49_ESOLU|nr:kinetochore protein Spc25 [Esox lucius]
MACIKDAHIGSWVSNKMEELRNKKLAQVSGEVMESGLDWVQPNQQFFESCRDKCSKKCKEDEMLFETLQFYHKDMEHTNSSVAEKKKAIAQTLSELEGKSGQKSKVIEKIEMLRLEQDKKKELIISQNQANKTRLKNLNRAKQVFQDHLGLEIRKINGDTLQFIFRNINPKDPVCAYTFRLRINECGSYQILSSDPPLERMSYLEKRLQETNSFSAFLANIRREFVNLLPEK